MEIPFAVEQDLIGRSRTGDDSAFEQLVNAFTPELFRVVRRMTDTAEDAENIIQETFWRVWKNLARYREDRRFFPYLVTIAANLVRDLWRKKYRNPSVALEDADFIPDDSPTPESQVVEAEQMTFLAGAVAKLPATYRMVVALRYDADLSYEDIAAALDIPLNTVRTYLFRAKGILRENMKEAYG